jgi:hypothetical protein
MWAKHNTLERKLADAMQYEYCELYDTARSALRALGFARGSIPSNVCGELYRVLPHARIWPVSAETGLAPGVNVHLYGYQSDRYSNYLSIDPLMTGYLRPTGAHHTIISFGHKKMLDAGGGGALLCNYRSNRKSNFSEQLRGEIEYGLRRLLSDIRLRRGKIGQWDCWLGDSCVRIPREQIMPWRVMRRIPEKRDMVVKAIRDAGYPVGTNYPPLPGVTDPGAIQWGREVINFFPDSDAKAISEIVKRTLDA